MPLSFKVLFSALVMCLGAVSAAPVIVTDEQTKQEFRLPAGLGGTLYDALYDTSNFAYQLYDNTPNPAVLLPGSTPMDGKSIIVNVTWAGDLSDQFTVNTPAGLSVALLPNSDSVCSLTNATLTATDGSCAYQLSWVAPFKGTFAINYSNSTNTAGTETVNVEFIKGALITGDPQFVGLRGQSYQVHGLDGGVYNLISEQNTQINSRFVFLTEGECPTEAPAACWSHPGSYMGDMSFQAIVDGKLHAALVSSGPAKKGFASVQMDGKALKVGETASFGSFSLTYSSTHGVQVSVENYSLQLTNSDMFLNMALSAKVALSQLQSHGLIGQTHANKVYKSAIRYIEGEVDDYLITDSDVFGSDCVYNRFNL